MITSEIRFHVRPSIEIFTILLLSAKQELVGFQVEWHIYQIMIVNYKFFFYILLEVIVGQVDKCIQSHTSFAGWREN